MERTLRFSHNAQTFMPETSEFLAKIKTGQDTEYNVQSLRDEVPLRPLLFPPGTVKLSASGPSPVCAVRDSRCGGGGGRRQAPPPVVCHVT